MSQDHVARAAAQIRRQDRAIDDEAWIQRFLRGAAVGSLATLHGDQPFLNSNIFVYDQAAHCLYLHTARVGRTRANIERHSRVCFSVMEMGRLLPAEEALEFSVEYAGVTIFGAASIVSDDREAKRAPQNLLYKYAPQLRPGREYRPPVAEELRRTTVIRVDIESWSGKMKAVSEEFPGAFVYASESMLASNRV